MLVLKLLLIVFHYMTLSYESQSFPSVLHPRLHDGRRGAAKGLRAGTRSFSSPLRRAGQFYRRRMNSYAIACDKHFLCIVHHPRRLVFLLHG